LSPPERHGRVEPLPVGIPSSLEYLSRIPSIVTADQRIRKSYLHWSTSAQGVIRFGPKAAIRHPYDRKPLKADTICASQRMRDALSNRAVRSCLTKTAFPTLIYRRTGNLRAVQLLLGHTKIESTVRYLGIEVDDALAIAEQVDV
jgi:hypothetical protein